MIKILIFGMGSMIGHQLYNFLSNKKVKVFGTSRDNRLILKNKNIYKYDPLKNFSDIEHIFKKVKPDYLINTIGVIKHRKEINNFKNTIYLNSIFPHKLAKISIINKIKLIHLSTDCVFSGDKGNYSESDIPDASDLYGISKKLGEINYKDSLTLRTSFIGFEKKNNTGLFDWIINSKEPKIFGFTRAYYNGFTTLELSKIIFKVIKLNLPISGLYNLSSSKISKYRLLKIINKAFNLNKNIVKNTNFSCNRTLNSKLFFKKIKYKVPNWHKMISEMKLLKKNDI